MCDWIIPPPKRPSKTPEEFQNERKARVKELIGEGYLKSELMIVAMSKVPREEFVTKMYRDYAYEETPLPIPGEATISCPHSYPLFYEALALTTNDMFLEIGAGSGYGAAIAREVVGAKGKVVSIEIERSAFRFSENNLNRLGYNDILLVLGDGNKGCPCHAPFDKISVTASCREVPKPLLEQLNYSGSLIIPIGIPEGPQALTLFKKDTDGSISSQTITQVQYMALKSTCGLER